MANHKLKTDPDVYDAVEAGLKTFEVRQDDRGYEVDDTLELMQTRYSAAQMKEGMPLEFTGKSLVRRVSYILRGPSYCVPPGVAILALQQPAS